MAEKKVQKKQAQNRSQKKDQKQRISGRKKWHSERHLSFGTANYVTFFLGLFSIVVGFILLDMEFMTLAPLLLVIGYSILIPLSILLGIGKGGAIEERIRESGGKLE